LAEGISNFHVLMVGNQLGNGWNSSFPSINKWLAFGFPGTRAPGTDAAMSLGTGFDSLQNATTKSC